MKLTQQQIECIIDYLNLCRSVLTLDNNKSYKERLSKRIGNLLSTIDENYDEKYTQNEDKDYQNGFDGQTLN